MTSATTRTLIVGGGLSGLYSALLLDQRQEDFLLLEARDRLGGRILSSKQGGSAFDLGPSWFWPGFQPRIRQLLDDLQIGSFPQPTAGDAVFEDETGQLARFPTRDTEPKSYRVDGGVERLVTELARRLPEEKILRSVPVRRIERRDAGVWVEATLAEGMVRSYEADRVLLTIPPRLLARSLEFDPPLPKDVLRRFSAIPTWMAGHAKALALYDEPVWRARGLSGQAFSHRGPLAEIHDASPREGGPFAIFGFFGISATRRKAAGSGLAAACVDQLERLFGPEMRRPIHLRIKDWSEDPWTATEEDFEPPTHHPAYGLPAAARELWNGRLRLSSTETSAENGGYLEGALEAATAVVSW